MDSFKYCPWLFSYDSYLVIYMYIVIYSSNVNLEITWFTKLHSRPSEDVHPMHK